jgi:hypothetical protein
MEEGKITLDAIITGTTSFPLTVSELQKFMDTRTHDAENMEFLIDLVQCSERQQIYLSMLSDDQLKNSTMSLATLKWLTYEPLKVKTVDKITTQIMNRLQAHNLTNSTSLPLDPEIYKQFCQKEHKGLIDLYLSANSQKELNISANARTEALKLAQTSTMAYDAFNACFREVYANIESNAVPRFVSYVSKTNLSDRLVRKRLMMSVVTWVLVVGINAVLMVFNVNSLFRILTLPFCAGFLFASVSYRQRFCINLGRKSVVHGEDGEEKKIVEACVLKSHAKKQQELKTVILIGTVAFLVILLVLPPYQFTTMM